jgi:hypothetical protein
VTRTEALGTCPAPPRDGVIARKFRTIDGRESANLRVSGYGGIAYRQVSNTYVALFSRFIPCGVWEAVYIIDGLPVRAGSVFGQE